MPPNKPQVQTASSRQFSSARLTRRWTLFTFPKLKCKGLRWKYWSQGPNPYRSTATSPELDKSSDFRNWSFPTRRLSRMRSSRMWRARQRSGWILVGFRAGNKRKINKSTNSPCKSSCSPNDPKATHSSCCKSTPTPHSKPSNPWCTRSTAQARSSSS